MKQTLTKESGLKAFDSRMSLGRRNPTNYPGDPFIADILTITQSRIFARLANKTQVFDPRLPVVNRLTHTLQVMSIATQLAERLNLNIHLVQAASLLHDCGHTVISHLGERTLSDLAGKEFRHERMSINLAVATGMNLSYETLNAAYLHSRGNKKLELKGGPEDNIVMFADKLAYVFADIDDVLRMKIIDESAVNRARRFLDLRFCMDALVKESLEQGMVSFQFSDEAKVFAELKDWMHGSIYIPYDLRENRQKQKAEMIELFEHLNSHRDLLQIDPILSIALMNDKEMHEAFLLMRRFDIGSLEAINATPWKELHDEVAGMNIFELNLNTDDYQRI